MIARIVASVCRHLLSGFYEQLERERRSRAQAAAAARTVARTAALSWRLDYFAERLEPRLLLTQATPTNLPVWVPQGPGPISGGQTAGIDGSPTTGAVNIIAVRPLDPDTAYIGTVGGGIWKTENARATASAGPTWVAKTDNFPTGSITSLVFDLTDTARNTLYA